MRHFGKIRLIEKLIEVLVEMLEPLDQNIIHFLGFAFFAAQAKFLKRPPN